MEAHFVLSFAHSVGTGDWTFLKRQEAAPAALGGRYREFPPSPPTPFWGLGERDRVRGPKELTGQPHVLFIPSLNAPRDAYFRFWPGMPPTPCLSPRITERQVIRGERRRISAKRAPRAALGVPTPRWPWATNLTPVPGFQRSQRHPAVGGDN